MNTFMHVIDTLQIYERLKKAKASDALSKEVASIFNDVIENDIANKQDIQKLDTNLEKVRLNLETGMETLKLNLETSIDTLRLNLETSIDTLRLNLEANIENVRLNLENVRLNLKKDIEHTRSELKTDIEKSKSELLKWIIGWVTGLIVAQTGLILSFLKFAV